MYPGTQPDFEIGGSELGCSAFFTCQAESENDSEGEVDRGGVMEPVARTPACHGTKGAVCWAKQEIDFFWGRSSNASTASTASFRGVVEDRR
eukprot:1028547-Rhodomonas_salina.1